MRLRGEPASRACTWWSTRWRCRSTTTTPAASRSRCTPASWSHRAERDARPALAALPDRRPGGARATADRPVGLARPGPAGPPGAAARLPRHRPVHAADPPDAGRPLRRRPGPAARLLPGRRDRARRRGAAPRADRRPAVVAARPELRRLRRDDLPVGRAGVADAGDGDRRRSRRWAARRTRSTARRPRGSRSGGRASPSATRDDPARLDRVADQVAGARRTAAERRPADRAAAAVARDDARATPTGSRGCTTCSRPRSWTRTGRVSRELSDDFLGRGRVGDVLRDPAALRAAAREHLLRRRVVAAGPRSRCRRRAAGGVAPTRRPLLPTGEAIFPWMFEVDGALAPLREAAELLAAYDVARPLRPRPAREERGAGGGGGVPRRHVRRVVLLPRGGAADRQPRTWVTNELGHDGLRTDARVIERLLDMPPGTGRTRVQDRRTWPSAPRSCSVAAACSASGEVGMLHALLEADVGPTWSLGTSVGAVNGAAVAADPTIGAVETARRGVAAARRQRRLPGRRAAPGPPPGADPDPRAPQRAAARAADRAARRPADRGPRGAVPVRRRVSIERAAEHWFTTGPVVDAVLA